MKFINFLRILLFIVAASATSGSLTAAAAAVGTDKISEAERDARLTAISDIFNRYIKTPCPYGNGSPTQVGLTIALLLCRDSCNSTFSRIITRAMETYDPTEIQSYFFTTNEAAACAVQYLIGVLDPLATPVGLNLLTVTDIESFTTPQKLYNACERVMRALGGSADNATAPNLIAQYLWAQKTKLNLNRDLPVFTMLHDPDYVPYGCRDSLTLIFALLAANWGRHELRFLLQPVTISMMVRHMRNREDHYYSTPRELECVFLYLERRFNIDRLAATYLTQSLMPISQLSPEKIYEKITSFKDRQFIQHNLFSDKPVVQAKIIQILIPVTYQPPCNMEGAQAEGYAHNLFDLLRSFEPTAGATGAAAVIYESAGGSGGGSAHADDSSLDTAIAAMGAATARISAITATMGAKTGIDPRSLETKDRSGGGARKPTVNIATLDNDTFTIAMVSLIVRSAHSPAMRKLLACCKKSAADHPENRQALIDLVQHEFHDTLNLTSAKPLLTKDESEQIAYDIGFCCASLGNGYDCLRTLGAKKSTLPKRLYEYCYVAAPDMAGFLFDMWQSLLGNRTLSIDEAAAFYDSTTTKKIREIAQVSTLDLIEKLLVYNVTNPTVIADLDENAAEAPARLAGRLVTRFGLDRSLIGEELNNLVTRYVQLVQAIRSLLTPNEKCTEIMNLVLSTDSTAASELSAKIHAALIYYITDVTYISKAATFVNSYLRALATQAVPAQEPADKAGGAGAVDKRLMIHTTTDELLSKDGTDRVTREIMRGIEAAVPGSTRRPSPEATAASVALPPSGMAGLMQAIQVNIQCGGTSVKEMESHFGELLGPDTNYTTAIAHVNQMKKEAAGAARSARRTFHSTVYDNLIQALQNLKTNLNKNREKQKAEEVAARRAAKEKAAHEARVAAENRAKAVKETATTPVAAPAAPTVVHTGGAHAAAVRAESDAERAERLAREHAEIETAKAMREEAKRIKAQQQAAEAKANVDRSKQAARAQAAKKAAEKKAAEDERKKRELEEKERVKAALIAELEARIATLNRQYIENERHLKTLSDVCAVCTVLPVQEHLRVIQLPCGHMFGNDCIKPWLASNNTCPTCRTKIVGDFIENVLDTMGTGDNHAHTPEYYVKPLTDTLKNLKDRIADLTAQLEDVRAGKTVELYDDADETEVDRTGGASGAYVPGYEPHGRKRGRDHRGRKG